MNPQIPGLADIIEPPAIGFFPPAWGWWVLAGALIAVIALSIWLAVKLYRRHQFSLKGYALLDEALAGYQSTQNTQAYCRDLNQALKRYWFACTDQHDEIASLSGQNWTARLQAVNPRTSLSSQTLAALSDGPYRPIESFNAQSVDAEVRQWLKTVSPGKLRQSAGGHS